MLAILQTRAELLTVELEEEAQRLVAYLLWLLVLLFCAGMAAILGVLLLVVLFWDSNRVAVIVALAAFFGIVALAIAVGVRRCWRRKPRFLAATLDEFSKDADMLKPSDQERMS